MSDEERPKPLYGEYASEEERALALKRSGASPLAEPKESRTGSSPRPTPASTLNRRNSVDRITTVFLLAFGAVFILGGAPNYLNFGGMLRETLQGFGVSDYPVTEQAAGFGIAMLASQVIFWIAAAVLSYRRIARHALAWWVPILAGVLSFVVLVVLLGSLLATDPGVLSTISNPR